MKAEPNPEAPSALESALALVDFGPCKTSVRPQDWINVAAPMCAHCEGAEDVVQAAARIITAEYRKALAALRDTDSRLSGDELYEQGWSNYPVKPQKTPAQCVREMFPENITPQPS